MDFILVCTVWLALLFCAALFLDWLVYRWRDFWSQGRYSWERLARFSSSDKPASGSIVKRAPGKVPSLGSLRVSRSRYDQLNGPPEPPAGA